MAKTKVINCYKDKNQNAFHIGRGSIFGNPYSHQDNTTASVKVETREEAIRMYRLYLYNRIKADPDFRLKLLELEGRVLSCYCKPLPCHGDIIIKAIEWLRSLQEITPFTDGINHINVYSKGNTLLGRLLSNFAHTPFRLVDHGSFASVEGYWYWLSTKDDRLRLLHGAEAKQYGREVRGTDWPKDEEFKKNIKKALKAKILGSPSVQSLLKENTLPLKHYYVQDGGPVYPKEGCQWMLDEIELIQNTL